MLYTIANHLWEEKIYFVKEVNTLYKLNIFHMHTLIFCLFVVVVASFCFFFVVYFCCICLLVLFFYISVPSTGYRHVATVQGLP